MKKELKKIINPYCIQIRQAICYSSDSTAISIAINIFDEIAEKSFELGKKYVLNKNFKK